MTQREKPIEERIGLSWGYLPPWSSDPVDMPLDQVEEKLKSIIPTWAKNAHIYRPVDTNQVWITFINRSNYEPFKLILTPKGTTTIISMNELPDKTWFYFFCIHVIQDRTGFHTSAPKIYEDDKDFVAAGLPPAPKPKRLTAKELLAEYRRRKRKNKKLTLKAFCAQTGYKYDSIKAAKYRIEKLKTEKRES